MRLVGLQLRVTDNLLPVLEKARSLELPIFQCFLLNSATGRMLAMSPEVREKCVQLIREFKNSYFHISYYGNPCDPEGIMFLRRELELGKSLGFTAAILHPGSAKWCGDKEQGIRVLVDTLNSLLADERTNIPIYLENSAHGKLSIGGDLNDFTAILNQIKYPELVRVCIDTAHAYVYGYDLVDEARYINFITLLANAIGFDKIALLHLNDTVQPLGSFLDKHAIIGQGNIGTQALVRFAQHPSLAQVPIILELPAVTDEEELNAYRQAREML